MSRSTSSSLVAQQPERLGTRDAVDRDDARRRSRAARRRAGRRSAPSRPRRADPASPRTAQASVVTSACAARPSRNGLDRQQDGARHDGGVGEVEHRPHMRIDEVDDPTRTGPDRAGCGRAGCRTRPRGSARGRPRGAVGRARNAVTDDRETHDDGGRCEDSGARSPKLKAPPLLVVNRRVSTPPITSRGCAANERSAQILLTRSRRITDAGGTEDEEAAASASRRPPVSGATAPVRL